MSECFVVVFLGLVVRVKLENFCFEICLGDGQVKIEGKNSLCYWEWFLESVFIFLYSMSRQCSVDCSFFWDWIFECSSYYVFQDVLLEVGNDSKIDRCYLDYLRWYLFLMRCWFFFIFLVYF